MKGGVCREATKGGVVDRYMGEGSGGVRSSEGQSQSFPAYLVAGLSGSGLPPSTSTVHSPYSNEAFNHQGRVYGPPQGRFMYQEAPDVQQTSESVGAKADSGSSSFASTPSKKPKGDLKLRTVQATKSQVKGDKLPAAVLKHSLALSNDSGMQMNVEQEMHQMRQTILEQEALFREQVRELHRVHRVQTLLMGEMKKRDPEMLSFSSGTSHCGPSQTPTDFASISSGGKRNPRGPVAGQILENPGYSLQATIAHVHPLKGGAEIPQSEADVGLSTPEIKLFGGSERSERVQPVRRTFDLERPPEDDDDEQERKQEEQVKPVQETIKFIGLPESSADAESEVSLNLGTGWDRGKVERVGRDFLSSSLADEQERENSRVLKRPREMEEAPLLPLFAAKAESLVRESPLRPTPKVAKQNFLGGLFHLQLGRKEETPFNVDINATAEETEVVKKERLSLNLEVDEKSLPAASQAQPHWLFQGQPVKKAPCNPEAPTFSSLPSFPPSGSSEEGIMKLRTSSQMEDAGSSVPHEGPVWSGDRQGSGNAPKSRPQASHMQRQAEEGVQPGIGVYRTPFLAVGGANPTVPGYASYKMGQGVGDASREGLTLCSSWRDGESPNNGFPHGVFAPSHSLGAGGLPALGVQLRSFEGHPSFATQGLVVGPAVNIGTGTAAFVADSNSGVWYQQRSSYSQFQQYQQQQQLASLQAQATAQGPWQAPLHIPQGGPYPQGAIYAIPTGAGSSIGLPLDGLRRMREDLPGANWPAGNVGPPFTTSSIVAPPKPPFKRPPKLVLTHDGTTMELKLVSPEKGGLKSVQDKSFSGSSEEELGDASRTLERRESLSIDAGAQNRSLKDRDDNNAGYQGGAVRYPRGGKRERDERATSSPLKETISPRVEWVEKPAHGSHGRDPAVRIPGLSEGDSAAAHEETVEGVEDADGSDGGSGGSGVGDVINPGERTSPPLGTFATVGNLPAGEGEEVLHMGELGIQADSESQAMKVDRPFKSVMGPNMNRTTSEDKPGKHQELPQDQLASSFASNSSLAGRKVPRGSSEVSETPSKRMRVLHSSTEEEEGQAPSQTLQHRSQEQSATSSGCLSNMPENGSRPHGLSPEYQGSDDLRNVNTQFDLQRSSGSTSEPRANLMKLQETGGHAKDRTKSKEGSERQTVDMNVERGKNDAKQNKAVASSFGDAHMQEKKPGHSKQLSGASTTSPVGAEKGGAHHNPHSPGLHQVPSLTIEDAEGKAEGSSIIVSQASETVQGNGRSPLRTGEWVAPPVMEQGHLGSSGGIKHSCEEVDGTLVERLRGGGMEHKGKDVCPEGNNSASFNQKNLGQSDAAAMDTTDPSSSGMCISQTTTKTSQCVKGDPMTGPGVSKAERQNAESRRTTALASEVDEGETDISGLKHSNQPAVLNTEKPEGSLDGDKDSVNSSKSIHEQDRINVGNASVSGKVLHGHGVTRSKKLPDAFSKSKVDLGPAALSTFAPSPQSTVSGPPMNRRVPPEAVQEEVDELSENPCENSNLAATLLLSLAPKGPSSSGSYSKAEKKRSLSILERSTDRSNDVVHLKRELYGAPSKVSKPNSSSLSSDFDLGPSASNKCQTGMLVTGISKENDRHTSLSRGEKTVKSMEPQSPPKLDFFESVTLMLKESKLLKDKPMAGKDAQNQSSDWLQPRQTTQSSGTKPVRKKKNSKSAHVDTAPKKVASKPRVSDDCQCRDTISGSRSESGLRSENAGSGETGHYPAGQGHGKNNEDVMCGVSQQVSSDQDGESSKGGDSSKGDSMDNAHPRSFWGDARRRKRMQRPRNSVHSQAQHTVPSPRKVGH